MEGLPPKFSLLSMKLLADTVQQLSMARDISSIMGIVRTVARKLTGADGATFVLRDGDQCYYADEDAISPLWKGSRFPMSTCISGWTMLNKEPAVIENIYADDRIPADAYRPTFVKSLAMVPIRKLDPIGAIGNYWAEHRKPTEEEIGLLQALADITAVSIENVQVRNSLEERVIERTRELAESLSREKHLNELKSAFVSIASHEFRTPLAAIMTSVSLAEQYKETSQQEKRVKHYNRIQSSVKNLIDILNDFLSIDKLEHGKVETHSEEFELRGFLEDLVEEVEGMRKLGQEIHFRFEGSGAVSIDKKLLRNIVLNLLSNAIKYSGKDIGLDANVKAGEITISVKDQGVRIPADQQHNIFGKFFRASNTSEVQGTGLGLNIVQHYVTLLGGTIGFESKEGVGTTFTVRLVQRQQGPKTVIKDVNRLASFIVSE